MSKSWLTKKQVEIMRVICEGMSKEKFVPVDMGTLVSRLQYKTTKHSMQFSLRRLVMHGLITVAYEWRNQSYKRKHKIISPTEEGKRLFEESI